IFPSATSSSLSEDANGVAYPSASLSVARVSLLSAAPSAYLPVAPQAPPPVYLPVDVPPAADPSAYLPVVLATPTVAISPGAPTENTAVVEIRPGTTLDTAPTPDLMVAGSPIKNPAVAEPPPEAPTSAYLSVGPPPSAAPILPTLPGAPTAKAAGVEIRPATSNAAPTPDSIAGGPPTGNAASVKIQPGNLGAVPTPASIAAGSPAGYAAAVEVRPGSLDAALVPGISATASLGSSQGNAPAVKTQPGSLDAAPTPGYVAAHSANIRMANTAVVETRPTTLDTAPTPGVLAAGISAKTFTRTGTNGMVSTLTSVAAVPAPPPLSSPSSTSSTTHVMTNPTGFIATMSRDTLITPFAASSRIRTPSLVRASDLADSRGIECPILPVEVSEQSCSPRVPQAAGHQSAGLEAAGFQAAGFQTSGGGQTGSLSPDGSSSTPRPQTGVANGATYSVGPSSAVVNGKTIGYATPTTAIVASGKVVVVDSSGAVNIQNIPDQSSPPQPRKSVTRNEYFIGAFLPTILAVLFTIPWYILFAAVQEMEPFYQLANPQGALACDSICLDYRASVNIIATFKAGLRGHLAVLWAGLCSIVVLALAPLASETVFIGFVGQGRCTATSSRDTCNPQLSVYPVAARAVQGILGLVAVFTICLAITTSRRNSGVYANPSRIAGIATLFQNSSLIEDFRQLHPDGFNSGALGAQLRGSRYRLGQFQHRDGSMDYGLMRYPEVSLHSDEPDFNSQYSDVTDSNSHHSHRIVPNKGRKYISVSTTAIEFSSTQTRKPKPSYFLHPATIVAFAVFLVGLLTLVVCYNQTGGDTAFERFMDSQTFGVTFMFTAMGVGIKIYWDILDEHLRATHPYLLLIASSKKSTASPPSSSKAKQSILASPPGNPFTGLVYSLRMMAWLPCWLSIVAVLTEPLIVALATIPFKAGTAYMAYRASTYITIGVLSCMLLGIIGVLRRQITNSEVMRRVMEAAEYKSVGRVMGLVCGSKMLSSFRGLAELDGKNRDEILRGWERGYKMGQLAGVDGVERWGVDEVGMGRE
ncbi:MAG: hypothetical protein Q9221_003652, partial [Calogaya cf. arnoldii]